MKIEMALSRITRERNWRGKGKGGKNMLRVQYIPV